MKYKTNGKSIFPGYAIEKVQDVKVAFIGMTLEGTPKIVSPDGIRTVDFLDEAATVNALVPVLKRQGVKAIVVLLHEGGSTTTPGNGAGGAPALINSCVNPTGALPPIVDAMHDEIDIVITGHTNWAVNCVIDGKVVTGAAAQGRLVTDIDAQLDPEHEGLREADLRQQPHRHAGRHQGRGRDLAHRRVQRRGCTDRRGRGGWRIGRHDARPDRSEPERITTGAVDRGRPVWRIHPSPGRRSR